MEKFFVLEQCLTNKFSDNECHPKMFPLQKKNNYGIHFIFQLLYLLSPPRNGTHTVAAGTGTLSSPPTHTLDDLIDDITLPTDHQCNQQSHDASYSYTSLSHDLLGHVDLESPMPELKNQTQTTELVGSRDLNYTPSISNNDSFGSSGKDMKTRKKKVSD